MDNKRIARELVRIAKDIAKYTHVDWETYIENEIEPRLKRDTLEGYKEEGGAGIIRIDLSSFIDESTYKEPEDVAEMLEYDLFDALEEEDGIEYTRESIKNGTGEWSLIKSYR